MRDISNTTGLFGYGETSGSDGDSSTLNTRKAYFESIIQKANTVPLIRIFKFYNIKVNNIKSSLICPFKNHREKTGSFVYYPDTNSFCCFGCKRGSQYSHACEFVAYMEDISKFKAAEKILKLFSGDTDPLIEIKSAPDFNEQLNIITDFSNITREFRKKYLDEVSQSFIDQRCETFDKLNEKFELSNDSLKLVADLLKEQILFFIENKKD